MTFGPRTGIVDDPSVLPRLLDPQLRAVAVRGREVLDVPGVVLDAIEPRRPDRHHQLDRRASPRRDRGLDLGDVLVGRREPDRIDDRLASFRHTRPRDVVRQAPRQDPCQPTSGRQPLIILASWKPVRAPTGHAMRALDGTGRRPVMLASHDSGDEGSGDSDRSPLAEWRAAPTELRTAHDDLETVPEAPAGRQHVARGVSPWTAIPTRTLPPGGLPTPGVARGWEAAWGNPTAARAPGADAPG